MRIVSVDSVYQFTEFLKGNPDLPSKNFNVANVKGQAMLIPISQYVNRFCLAAAAA